MWVADGRGTGGKVIGMTERRAAAAEHPALAQLRGYWEGLRAGGALPTRAMIDPRGIEDALEFAFVAERIAPGAARIRLAGMHLNEILGMEVRGMPLSAFLDPASRAALAGHVEEAFAGPAAVALTLQGVTGFGRPALTARLILLPLRDEAGGVVRVLGGLAAEGGIGRPPRRFRLVAAQVAPCGEAAPRPPAAAGRLAPLSAGPAAARPSPAPGAPEVAGFAEPPAPYGAAGAPAGPAAPSPCTPPGAPPDTLGDPGSSPGTARGAVRLRLVHSAD